MSLFLLKLFLAPVLIAFVSLIARRWGGMIGGAVGGLPLASGSICFLVMINHGADYAAQAAAGAITGVIAVVAFCYAYSVAAQRHGWSRSFAYGLCAYLAAMILLATLALDFAASLLVLSAVLMVALHFFPSLPEEIKQVSPPSWDIPAKMFIAAIVVASLTALSDAAGASFVGLLAPLPVFSSILSTFAHKQQGGVAAQHILRGFILAAFASATFFSVVFCFLSSMGALAYVLAIAATILVNALALELDKLAHPSRAAVSAT